MSEEFIWVIIFMMPVTVVMWLLGMWANHEDYKKEHNIKGWSDKEMNAKQIILTSILTSRSEGLAPNGIFYPWV